MPKGLVKLTSRNDLELRLFISQISLFFSEPWSGRLGFLGEKTSSEAHAQLCHADSILACHAKYLISLTWSDPESDSSGESMKTYVVAVANYFSVEMEIW